MTIGIDASRAFLEQRTGIEEYSYQVMKHLREPLPSDATVVLYVRKKIRVQLTKFKIRVETPQPDFDLPLHWTVKGIWAPRFWTQYGLSFEMLFRRPDILFIPAHIVPLIHPKRTVVVIHGLEYEFCPESYSWWERWYMRYSIKFSVRAASAVIAVSENTKRDLMKLYAVPAEKISVVYEGVSLGHRENSVHRVSLPPQVTQPFFLFIGRLEVRKNLAKIIEAFELFKAKTGRPHKLVLAGKPGYGHQTIKQQITNSRYQGDILALGYISEEEKWELLKQAAVFLFPSLYEGFGLPILEAQLVGTPVITATTSSLPEVAGDGALLVDPNGSKKLARAMKNLVEDERQRADIIERATRNMSRFGWSMCSRLIARILS